jgi:hypothetical protein
MFVRHTDRLKQLLRAAAASGEASLRDLAMPEDRVAVQQAASRIEKLLRGRERDLNRSGVEID